MPTNQPTWTIVTAPVDSPEAADLLHDYYLDVSDSWHLLHDGRRTDPAELAEGLAGYHNDDLVPPTGLFLLGRLGSTPAGCAGLRLLDADRVALTRVYVRPAQRGTGGGAALLTAADDAARSLGASRIVLDTRLDLVAARALYQRHGYTEIPAWNDDRYAEIWYGRDL